MKNKITLAFMLCSLMIIIGSSFSIFDTNTSSSSHNIPPGTSFVSNKCVALYDAGQWLCVAVTNPWEHISPNLPEFKVSFGGVRQSNGQYSPDPKGIKCNKG